MERWMQKEGEIARNENEKLILELCIANDMIITNTM